MKKQFRKTWIHEVIIEAETKEEAQQVWESISLGKLDQEVADEEIYSHEFVESVSFEDENYDEWNGFDEKPIEWTKEDAAAAYKEGWSIYNCHGSEQGLWQVQSNDEQGLLKDDTEAWMLVGRGEQPHHINARRYLKENNRQEYERIIKHTIN